ETKCRWKMLVFLLESCFAQADVRLTVYNQGEHAVYAPNRFEFDDLLIDRRRSGRSWSALTIKYRDSRRARVTFWPRSAELESSSRSRKVGNTRCGTSPRLLAAFANRFGTR